MRLILGVLGTLFVGSLRTVQAHRVFPGWFPWWNPRPGGGSSAGDDPPARNRKRSASCRAGLVVPGWSLLGITEAYGHVGVRPRKGWEQRCVQIKQAIENVEKKIKERGARSEERSVAPTRSAPGDKAQPSLSKSGHRRLINEDKGLLAALYGKYLSNCTKGPLPSNPPIPLPAPDPWPAPEGNPGILPTTPNMPVVPIIPDMPIPAIPIPSIPTIPVIPSPIVVPVPAIVL